MTDILNPQPSAAAGAGRSSLGAIHILLTIQTAALILGSLNRLGPWTLGYVAENEFLRWVDLHNMLTVPLISVAAFYLLKREISRGAPREAGRPALLLDLIFILGIYLLGASYGDHEVTNYLHARFCEPAEGVLCRIVIFNDDTFSHWLFFTGFVMMNGALMLLQVIFPHRPAAGRDTLFLALNGLFVGLAILANLGFEAIGLDLYVVVLLAVLALVLLRRHGRQPLLVYYTTAYTFGLAATLLVRVIL